MPNGLWSAGTPLFRTALFPHGAENGPKQGVKTNVAHQCPGLCPQVRRVVLNPNRFGGDFHLFGGFDARFFGADLG